MSFLKRRAGDKKHVSRQREPPPSLHSEALPSTPPGKPLASLAATDVNGQLPPGHPTPWRPGDSGAVRPSPAPQALGIVPGCRKNGCRLARCPQTPQGRNLDAGEKPRLLREPCGPVGHRRLGERRLLGEVGDAGGGGGRVATSDPGLLTPVSDRRDLPGQAGSQGQVRGAWRPRDSDPGELVTWACSAARPEGPLVTQ